MTSLTGNILNRVRRLPKPASATAALQPIFEAVSNGMHAIDDKKLHDRKLGQISVDIVLSDNPSEIEVTVSDNGIGLDKDRFEAFKTTDTPFKFERGGKGIGRLLWLDAFDNVQVTSIFKQGKLLKRRSFKFVLADKNQIRGELLEDLTANSAPTGTSVTFHGLRGSAYQKKFPRRPAAVIGHFGSHFIAEFILGLSPRVSLSVGNRNADFPEAIETMLVEARGQTEDDCGEFGKLKVDHFVFRSIASAEFDGHHQLHLIANGRTVMTRKIDGLLGFGRFGPDRKYVYHGCVSGDFLDERVNQERTHFNFDEATAERLAKQCAEFATKDALSEEASNYEDNRSIAMEAFLDDYPSFRFDETPALLARTPKAAMKAEQFASALVPIRIRRDIDRSKRIQQIVTELSDGKEVVGDFAAAIRKAADEVKNEERRQLTEYVLRRKIVLDVLGILIKRLRELEDGKTDYQLEKTIHQFICPMKVRGDDPSKVEATDHDLWVIDERLAFSRYFASDVPINKIVEGAKSIDKPDLFIWNQLHGLSEPIDEPLRRVMLVEFKKPGRKQYDERYNPMSQIARYLDAITGGDVESIEAERVRTAKDCVFHCYVVADIVGELAVQVKSWTPTADGRGRWMPLSGDYRGSVEIIEWKDLVSDARARNAAFINFGRG